VKKKEIYLHNIFLQALAFIVFKNNILRRFINTLSDRLVWNGSALLLSAFWILSKL